MDSLSLPTLPVLPETVGSVSSTPTVTVDFVDLPPVIDFPIVGSVNTYFYDAGPRTPMPYPDSDG